MAWRRCLVVEADERDALIAGELPQRKQRHARAHERPRGLTFVLVIRAQFDTPGDLAVQLPGLLGVAPHLCLRAFPHPLHTLACVVELTLVERLFFLFHGVLDEHRHGRVLIARLQPLTHRLVQRRLQVAVTVAGQDLLLAQQLVGIDASAPLVEHQPQTAPTLAVQHLVGRHGGAQMRKQDTVFSEHLEMLGADTRRLDQLVEVAPQALVLALLGFARVGQVRVDVFVLGHEVLLASSTRPAGPRTDPYC
ncbi:MAG: hypothetical protein ACR2MA_05760 [Egibacteraceae bacterium]